MRWKFEVYFQFDLYMKVVCGLKLNKKSICRWFIEFLIIAIVDLIVDFGNGRGSLAIELVVAGIIVFLVDVIIKRIQHDD